jgi:hypothetical protein
MERMLPPLSWASRCPAKGHPALAMASRRRRWEEALAGGGAALVKPPAGPTLKMREMSLRRAGAWAQRVAPCPLSSAPRAHGPAGAGAGRWSK